MEIPVESVALKDYLLVHRNIAFLLFSFIEEEDHSILSSILSGDCPIKKENPSGINGFSKGSSPRRIE